MISYLLLVCTVACCVDEIWIRRLNFTHVHEYFTVIHIFSIGKGEEYHCVAMDFFV